MSAFFLEDESSDQWEGLHGYKRSLVYSNIMLKKANQHLSDQVRSVFLSNKLSSLLPKLPASYPIDSLLTAFQLKDAGLMDLSKIYGQADSTISGPKLAAGDTVPNFYAVNELDSLVELRQFSDKTIYLNL